MKRIGKQLFLFFLSIFFLNNVSIPSIVVCATEVGTISYTFNGMEYTEEQVRQEMKELFNCSEEEINKGIEYIKTYGLEEFVFSITDRDDLKNIDDFTRLAEEMYHCEFNEDGSIKEISGVSGDISSVDETVANTETVSDEEENTNSSSEDNKDVTTESVVNWDNTKIKIVLIVLFGLCLVPTILFVVRGEQKIVKSTEYYSPDGLDPIEIERIYTGKNVNHVTALIPYLANKGYITISKNDEEESIIFEQIDVNYNGLSVYSENLLTGMFDGRGKISQLELKNSLPSIIKNIQIGVKNNLNTLWDKKKNLLNKIVFVTSVLALIISVIAYTCFGFSAYIIGMGLAAFTISFFICNKIKYRSKENLLIYGRVLSFKEFLEKADADTLKILVKENAEYFFDMLGYVYVFGIEEYWIKKFKELDLIPTSCSWYCTKNDAYFFDVDTFTFDFKSIK